MYEYVEGWHNRLNKTVGKAHPNIYELDETFKKEQASVKVTVTQLSSGSAPLRGSRRSQIRDRKIKELKERFPTNNCSLADYLP